MAYKRKKKTKRKATKRRYTRRATYSRKRTYTRPYKTYTRRYYGPSWEDKRWYNSFIQERSLRDAAADALIADIAAMHQRVAAPGDGPVINQPAAMMAVAGSPAAAVMAALSPVAPGAMGDINEGELEEFIRQVNILMTTPDAVPMSDEPAGAGRSAMEAGLDIGEGARKAPRLITTDDLI